MTRLSTQDVNIQTDRLFRSSQFNKIRLSYVTKSMIAFTLAEVLICLAIIGVVASLTVPALMNNINNQENITKLKKEYSILLQAYQSIKADNGGQFEAAISACPGGNRSGETCIKNVFKEKLNYTKDCDNNDGANLNVCFPQKTDIKYLNGTSIDGSSYINGNVGGGLMLNDGTSLTFYIDDPNCKSSISPNYKNRCGFIAVDVNGFKKPNQFGKDIYVLFIFADMIRPGSATTVDYFPDNCDSSGFTCAQKYLYNN